MRFLLEVSILLHLTHSKTDKPSRVTLEQFGVTLEQFGVTLEQLGVTLEHSGVTLEHSGATLEQFNSVLYSSSLLQRISLDFLLHGYFLDWCLRRSHALWVV